MANGMTTPPKQDVYAFVKKHEFSALFTTPSSRELYPPPITSPHYQLPPEALVLLFSS